MKAVVLYDDIDINSDKSVLILHQAYNNLNVNMLQLIELVMKLRSKPFAEIKDKKSSFDLIAGLIKK